MIVSRREAGHGPVVVLECHDGRRRFSEREGWRMFVQVIEGRVADAERLRDLMERWSTELRPGATGFLGSTAGVTDAGMAIAFARLDSAESARANSQRPE